jgi:hypothetical protein
MVDVAMVRSARTTIRAPCELQSAWELLRLLPGRKPGGLARPVGNHALSCAAAPVSCTSAGAARREGSMGAASWCSIGAAAEAAPSSAERRCRRHRLQH